MKSKDLPKRIWYFLGLSCESRENISALRIPWNAQVNRNRETAATKKIPVSYLGWTELCLVCTWGNLAKKSTRKKIICNKYLSMADCVASHSTILRRLSPGQGVSWGDPWDVKSVEMDLLHLPLPSRESYIPTPMVDIISIEAQCWIH